MERDFIPLTQFMQHLPPKQNFPYEVKASFAPLIARVESFSKKTAMSDLVYQEVMQKFKYLESFASEKDKQEEYDAHMEHLLAYYFPLFSQKDILGFVGSPFGQSFLYLTPALKELFQQEDYEIRMNNCAEMDPSFFPILHAIWLILDMCYQQRIDLEISETFTLRHRATGLEKHYRATVYLDSINVIKKKPLKPLTNDTLQELLNHYDDRDRWLAQFPPENFAFEGMSFVLFEDVTETEILSRIRERIGDTEEITSFPLQIQFIEQQLRSFLSSPDVIMGVVPMMMKDWNEKAASLSILSRFSEGLPFRQHPTSMKGSQYEAASQTGETIICRDLSQVPVTPAEEVLLSGEITSLILIPIKNKQGRILAIIELGASHQTPLSAFTIFRLGEIISLLEIGLNRFQRELENSIGVFMQKEFTSIHPSVDWKFRQVARRALFQKQDHIDMDISFPNVYPLFGQLDIVGSSRARSTAIQSDLKKNLTLLATTLQECRRQLDFPLLGMIAHKVENWKNKISDNFFSSDETQVSSFLLQEVHPLLRQLADNHAAKVCSPIQHYFQHIDPQLGIVYEERKAFELTISQINQSIAQFMENEEAKLQEVLPHYFELYKTDGIEYNIYLGQSLLSEGTFSEYYVKDFRLWQLISMCNMVRLLEKNKAQLPMPLSTAQLIFVYSNTLNIQFRKDEKKFDVEGVYNVRYEIIKKRIDKAYIAGKNERLTQAQHIAVAYLDDKDKAEYQQYLAYLAQEGYIEPKIEELTLEKVQGVDGIRALRVKVKTQEARVKEKVKRVAQPVGEPI